LIWHTRLLTNASLAALAQTLAPLLAFPRVTVSTLSMLTSASPAALAQMLAPLQLPLRNNFSPECIFEFSKIGRSALILLNSCFLEVFYDFT
jgi:hypothetical protein